MSEPFLISRRRVLIKLGIVLGGVAAGFPAAPEQADGRPGAAFAGALDQLIRHPDSAAAIGRAWLAQGGRSVSAPNLARELEQRLPPVAHGARGMTAAHLAELIRDDFVRGDVVNVEGWILSRTEARLCALFAA